MPWPGFEPVQGWESASSLIPQGTLTYSYSFRTIVRTCRTAFVSPPIMIIECMLAYLNKKLTMDKNYIKKKKLDPWGGGGGGTQVQRGAAPALCISRMKGSFFRPLQVRDFVKEGYFFVPRYEVWGVKIHKIYAALTPSDSLSYWASVFSATTCCR